MNVSHFGRLRFSPGARLDRLYGMHHLLRRILVVCQRDDLWPA
jgi:hypothetical protein